MAIDENDLIKLTHKYTQKNVVMMNVYWYRAGPVTGVVVERYVAEEFAEHQMAWINDIQALDVENISVLVENWTGGFAYFEKDVSGSFGTVVGQTGTTFNAIGMKLVPTTRLVRPGGKRYGGIVEDWISGNEIVTPRPVAIDNLAVFMDGGLNVSNGGYAVTLHDVVVKRPAVRGVPPYTMVEVHEWIVNPNITSQVSRKAGRGI